MSKILICYIHHMTLRERIKEIKHLQNKYSICVLENPRNLINIATVLRNVSAFGIEKLYVIGGVSPKSFEESKKDGKLANLSVGSNRWVFLKYFETTEECIKHLRKNLYTIAVTSSHDVSPRVKNLYKEKFTQKRLAIWFGNEANGVSKEAINYSDFCVQIPMAGIVESLNLGTSTGIILSYVSNQRIQYVFEKKKIRAKTKKQKQAILAHGPTPMRKKTK